MKKVPENVSRFVWMLAVSCLMLAARYDFPLTFSRARYFFPHCV